MGEMQTASVWKTVLLGEIPLLTFLLYILCGVVFWGAILLYCVFSLVHA
jgi:hypothetical protein